ncbi:MAG: hypothetical protein GKS02_06140 [Alphaproteobacteria bacterium]|nr:hypothetical protein [Alphaproteobacteria bacterium]
MRVIKGVVIGLAVLIFVALGAVVWAIFNLNSPDDNRAADNNGAGNNDAAAAGRIAETLSLGLPAGCEIADMELNGRRLAVRTAGLAGASDCARVYVIDLSSGAIINTVTP